MCAASNSSRPIGLLNLRVLYCLQCPEELRVSPDALALAGYLRSSSSLAGASAVLRDLAFAATTLTRAGLEGGDAYGLMLGAHAKRLPELAEACEEVLALSSDAEAAAAKEAFGTARSLLFATVDAESSTTGLKAAASTAGEQAESGTQGSSACRRRANVLI